MYCNVWIHLLIHSPWLSKMSEGSSDSLSLTKRLSFSFLVSLQLRSAYWWHNKVSLTSCKQFRHFLHSIFTHKGQQFLFVFVLLKYLVSSERRACQESWTQGGRSQSMEDTNNWVDPLLLYWVDIASLELQVDADSNVQKWKCCHLLTLTSFQIFFQWNFSGTIQWNSKGTEILLF